MVDRGTATPSDAATAARKSLAAMYGLVQEHAAMLAFVEAFWLMGVVFLLMIPFLPLLQYSKRKPQPPGPDRRTASLQKVDPDRFSQEIPEDIPEEEHHLVMH